MKTIFLMCTILLLFSACSKHLSLNYKDGIYSSKKGKNIAMSSLVDDVEHYPIIMIGDHHDTNQTHQFLNRFLQSLDDKGYRLHFANEWFSPKHNKLLESYINDDINITTLKEKREWEKFTHFSWDIVSPIYETIKQSGGKLYGVNISKQNRAKISLRQPELMDESLREFYNNLDLDVTAHKNLITPYFEHCDKMKKVSDERCQKRMYRVQVTWDTYMADESAKIAKRVLKTKKDKLIIFAGAMHIEYGLGIPLRFARKSNLPFFTISNHIYEANSSINIDTNKADSMFIYK